MPKTIDIGHVRYAVRFNKDLMADAGILGTCMVDTQMIYLDPLQGGDRLRETVLHEVLHGIFHQLGLKEYDSNQEETIVNGMAQRLLCVLRDNRRLVTFLQEPGH